ncbi:MAG: ComEC/Rec2 family competence protein [Parcubacteria group bacterium]
MTKSKIFLILSLSFLAGIFGMSFYYPQTVKILWLFFVLIGALIVTAVFYENRKALLISSTVIFFAGGAFLTMTRLERILNLSPEKQNFSGTVEIIKEPELNDMAQSLTVVPENDEDQKILVNVSAYQKFAYGEKLRLSCGLERPKNISPDFDYRMYLAAKGVYYQCQKPKIEKLSVSGGNKIYAGLISLKNNFKDNIDRLIPAPEAGLLVGLILGGSHQLSKDIQNDFSRTGLSHITAVSGYNVTIIAEYLMIIGIAIGLWRRQAFWFAAVGIILFVIITGLSASAVRAGVMGILLIWAMKNGRLANSQNAVIFSADVMLLSNPLLLRWDVGFQLSFLATLGIIYFYPIFDNYLVGKNKAFGLSEILFLTLSAQIFVLPIILFNFNQLSLISPLANLLILPFVPFTMLVGFLAAVSGFIWTPLAIAFAWLAFVFLKYETIVIHFLSELKYAAVSMKLAWWEVMLWYIILAGTTFLFSRMKRKSLNNQDLLMNSLLENKDEA